MAFFKQFLERIRAIPGVEAAGGDFNLPLGGQPGAQPDGRRLSGVSARAGADVNHYVITPDYFEQWEFHS